MTTDETMTADRANRELRYIASGIFEDGEGNPWVRNPQRGWTRVARDGKATRQARQLRTILRYRHSHAAVVARVAKTLDNGGWWATSCVELGYAR